MSESLKFLEELIKSDNVQRVQRAYKDGLITGVQMNGFELCEAIKIIRSVYRKTKNSDCKRFLEKYGYTK